MAHVKKWLKPAGAPGPSTQLDPIVVIDTLVDGTMYRYCPSHPIPTPTSGGAMSVTPARSSPSSDVVSRLLLHVCFGPHRGAQQAGETAGSRGALSQVSRP